MEFDHVGPRWAREAPPPPHWSEWRSRTAQGEAAGIEVSSGGHNSQGHYTGCEPKQEAHKIPHGKRRFAPWMAGHATPYKPLIDVRF